MTETTEYRIEHDTMGEVRVPKDALYAAQTQRAVENFPISGTGLESTQIAALARIKKAAALANKHSAPSMAPSPTRSQPPPTTSSPVVTTPTSPWTRTRPGRAPRRT
jgi:hypothetical protein